MSKEMYKIKYYIAKYGYDIISDGRSEILVLKDLVISAIENDNRALMHKLIQMIKNSDYEQNVKVSYIMSLRSSYRKSAYNSTISE